jgi:hypothetical protein
MMSSNKARRYLQHQKQYSSEPHNNPQLVTQSLIIDSATMRKFRGKTPQVSIPQICVNNNDEENNDHGHVAILNEFDQVLDNELKHISVLRTSSLKQNEVIEHIGIPVNQQRSFSFALGSKTNLDGEKHDDDDDDDDEPIDILPSKTIKLRASSKSSLSKETFSRLFHSLTFRSGNHLASKISVKRTDSQPQQHPCLACQNYPYLDFIPKNKKRPSIFGVLVSKFNASSSTTTETTLNRCSVCKRPLSKSISNNDDNQRLLSSKLLRDQKQLFLHIKRRQSLPSLFHNLLESSSVQQHHPSFSSKVNHYLIDNINHEQPPSLPLVSQSTISSTESDDSNENNSFKRQRDAYDESIQLTEKVSTKMRLSLVTQMIYLRAACACFIE